MGAPVSDTSVLNYLARLGHFSLLHQQFGHLDESDGRRRAAALGISAVGTVGVLLKAKHDGVFPELAPVLDQLVRQLGFRLHASLLAKILDAAGETQ